MGKSRKQKLHDKCRNMMVLGYRDGGISSNNEYNQFLCDHAPDMLQYMSVEGLQWIKAQMDEVYKNTIESDKEL